MTMGQTVQNGETVYVGPSREETRLLPVEESTVEMRLSPLAWPKSLESNSGGVATELSSAWDQAKWVFDNWREQRTKTLKDERLTPAGKHEALATWAKDELSDLEGWLARVDKSAADQEARLLKLLEEEFLGGPDEVPTEPHAIALQQEIRSYLRSLPEGKRTDEVRRLIEQGDRSAVRAVLSAPPYLTGLDQQIFNIVRDEAVKRTNPKRFAYLQGIREAREATYRAVDNVIRHIGSETRTLAELRAPRVQQ
jgi:hypothetical protein